MARSSKSSASRGTDASAAHDATGTRPGSNKYKSTIETLQAEEDGSVDLVGRVSVPYLNNFLSRMGSNPDLHCLAIDQALDSVGVAMYIPAPRAMSLLMLAADTLGVMDEGLATDVKAVLTALKAALTRGGPAIFSPIGSRKQPYQFAYVFTDGTKDDGPRSAVVLNFVLKAPPSDKPEWMQAREMAKRLADVAEQFMFYAKAAGGDAVACVEGMAMHGMTDSTGILPCLGLVYGSIWEEFSRRDTIKEMLRELPISSWKKEFSDKGNLSKDEIKEIFSHLGFGRFRSDDERDAVAMAMVSSVADAPLKLTNGRIRPTQQESADKRLKRNAIKERRKQRLLARGVG